METLIGWKMSIGKIVVVYIPLKGVLWSEDSNRGNSGGKKWEYMMVKSLKGDCPVSEVPLTF